MSPRFESIELTQTQSKATKDETTMQERTQWFRYCIGQPGPSAMWPGTPGKKSHELFQILCGLHTYERKRDTCCCGTRARITAK
eukprot:scaffold11954_cov51-Attheya_sp.AAC.1